MDVKQRVRRAIRAFREYPGQRINDGGRDGVLVVCGEPYGCGGSGLLHQPDVLPPAIAPESGPLPGVQVDDRTAPLEAPMSSGDSLYAHPGEVLEHFVAKLEEVPGVSVERGTGVGFAITRLKSLYDYERRLLPIKQGDTVRVNDDVTYGTSGPDVAGRVGTVINVDWNSSWEYWSVTVELVAGWTDWRGEKQETSRAKHFSFAPSSLTVVEDA